MAKKPKANATDKMFQKIVIGIAASIAVLAVVIIWNNRNQSFVGRIDGVRMPTASFSLLHNEMFNEWAMEFLMAGMPVPPEINNIVMEQAFENLVEMTLAVREAEALGLTLTAEEAEIAMQLADSAREFYGMSGLRNMGFNNASLERFFIDNLLVQSLYEHIIEQRHVSQEELDEAFNEFYETDGPAFYGHFVYFIDSYTQEDADALLARIADGEDFLELMREYSVTYDVEFFPVDEDGELIEHINIDFVTDDPELTELLRALEVDEVSDVVVLEEGFAYFIFKKAHIDEPDWEELREMHDEFITASLREEFFQEQMFLWREQADITRNNRIFN